MPPLVTSHAASEMRYNCKDTHTVHETEPHSSVDPHLPSHCFASIIADVAAIPFHPSSLPQHHITRPNTHNPNLSSLRLLPRAFPCQGHPLDTIKVRLQTQSNTNPEFTGMVDCFRKTMAKEGVAGLYAGAAAPLWGAMAHNAGVFFSYGMAKKVTSSLFCSNISLSFFLEVLTTSSPLLCASS